MSLALDKAGELPNGITHEQMLASFIAMSLGGAVVLMIGAGFLVWKASKNKKWSVWMLSILALWQAFDSIYGNIQLKEMYPGVIGVSDWGIAIVSSALWLYILFAAHNLKPTASVGDDEL